MKDEQAAKEVNVCHRISPLLIEELRKALEDLKETGSARVPRRDPNLNVPDAYPGTQLPLFVPNKAGELEPAELVWGFKNPTGTSSKLVFNTRIETALSQAQTGRGLWANPITTGRCLVPVRGFYEWTTRAPRDQRRQLRFTLPGHSVFLLAGVCGNGKCSVVTTEPNADISPIHSRMPLVLGPGESAMWLGEDYARLADRSHIRLDTWEE